MATVESRAICKGQVPNLLLPDHHPINRCTECDFERTATLFGVDVAVTVRRHHGCIDGKRGHPYASIACMDDIDGKRGHPYASMILDDSDILALVWLSGQ